MDQSSEKLDDFGESAAGLNGDTAKAEKAIDKMTAAVEDAGDEAKTTDSSVDKLGDAVSDATREAKQAEPAMDGAADGIKDVGDESRSAGDDLDAFAQKMAQAVAAGNLMADIAGGVWDTIKQFASAVWNLDEATEEYRVAQGKLNTAFQAAGYSTKDAKKTFEEFYAILGDVDTATEASQLLARLSTNQEDLSQWTTIAAGVNGTFGDSLPIEGLIEAANETAKVGQVTGVLADALNWVGISEDDFNLRLAQCANTEQRTALITDTLTAAYSSAAAMMRENNATVIRARESQLRLQDAQAKVGEQTSRLKTALSGALAPAMETIFNWTEKLVSAVADWAEGWERAVHAADVPIEVTTVEQAREKVAELNAEIARLRGEGYNEGNSSYLKTLTSQVGNLNAYIDENTAAENANADATRNAAEATDTMTVSANGFAVELANSNMTIEEATERLNTYTDAATNMFTQINTESEQSYEQLLANLDHNIEAVQAFGENMTQLASVLPPQLAEMFADGGPEMYAGVVAMLADANAGADPGLTALNEKFAQGGQAAAEAFIEASTGMPVDMETPASKMAEAMDNDVSCEQAGQSVVDRTASAVQARVNTAGFDSAGSRAMDQFIAGMNSRRGAVQAVAASIAQAAVATINNALNSIASGNYASRYSAGGLDYVPYNGYPSILHRGEAVLTADEADDWRRGERPAGNTSGVTIIQNIQSVPQTPVELAAATAAYFEQARWII